ncbi:MAG: dihydroorotate dehydrogenase-like protein [Phycisphaerae bacterium]|nr:dihydroorotate dehydrogenase-like protein [Phycisphaerae bacterium]
MDLTTDYMGLSLPTPLVAGASPLSQDIKNVEALQAAGAGAVVFHSIFEEQLSREAEAISRSIEQSTDVSAESQSFFPQMHDFKVGPEIYLEHLAVAKQRVSIPIIASLNCTSAAGWTDYARQIQQAGADALELNVYLVPTDPKIPGSQIEQVYLDILAAVRQAVTIPVAIKLSPFFSSMANMLTRLDRAGADGLVLFNRFYQPDIDLRELSVGPHLVLSTTDDLRLPMRWIAIMYGRLKASLAASSGVHTGSDAAKMILSGASVVQVVSSLLLHGIGHLTRMRDELTAILAEKGYDSVSQARGVLSQRTAGQPEAFERANYMETLASYA